MQVEHNQKSLEPPTPVKKTLRVVFIIGFTRPLPEIITYCARAYPTVVMVINAHQNPSNTPRENAKGN